MKILLLILMVILSTQVSAEFLPKSFSAQFDQEYISTLKGKVKKGNGTIDYQFPGNIRFKTTLPSEVLFVSNGIKTWYYRAPFIDGEAGEVTETSAKDGTSVFTKFFDSLKNGLTSNSMYNIIKNNQECKVQFVEKAEKEIFFSPEKGNVVFASAIDNWSFSIRSFAQKIAKRFVMNPFALEKFLWGKFYFQTKEKKIVKVAPTPES
jgi:outer membrane lipoprotein-sorting protein